MRWAALLLVCACGDNVETARVETVTALPKATVDVVFDRDNVAVARAEDGSVRRFTGRWNAIDMQGARAIDFGSDNDGALLVMSSIPRTLHRLEGGTLSPVGGIVIANFVEMPMQVPSGNRYVREVAPPQRSFVLSPGTWTWAETPPMFFTRPLRAYDGTLYATQAAGVLRFEPDGKRSLVVSCDAIGVASCTSLLLGGVDGERVIVADDAGVITFDNGEVERVALPSGLVPERIATGKELTVILAKGVSGFRLLALQDGALHALDTSDAPTDKTRLAVDHDGVVHIATTSLSKVVP